MKINEVAKLTGVTVRTLQYYDKIGLLKPSKTLDNGYRVYEKEQLETLQQILFYRELDFQLNEIKEIMNNPGYDRHQAMINQKELLSQKKTRLEKLISLLNKGIEGDKTMSFKEFDNTEIENTKNKYATEAKERWGNTGAYKEYTDRTSKYGKDQWNNAYEQLKTVIKEFADIRELQPDSQDAERLVIKWQNYITDNMYICTKEILAGLGQMYVKDERFKKNIDSFGEGTAEFMSSAIEKYCSQK